jgi:hypothetical protein
MKLATSLFFYSTNSVNFYHPIRQELRFSYWREGLDFVSALEIQSLPEGPLLPGETKLADVLVFDGGFCKTLVVGETLKFGSSLQEAIGEFLIRSILTK